MSPPRNTLSSKHRKPGASCGCAVRTRRRKAVAVDPQIKARNVRRLRRIAGQIRGLERMVGEERYCTDILIQISSVQEALRARSEEHTSELQSRLHLVCRLLLEKKKKKKRTQTIRDIKRQMMP